MLKRFRGFFYLITFVLAFRPSLSAGEGTDDRAEDLDSILQAGYETLASDPEAAIPFFEQALLIDSGNAHLHAQLGSIYVSTGRTDDALKEFMTANSLQPSDSWRLQIGYLLNSLNRNQESYETFDGLTSSEDADIRSASRRARAVLGGMLATQSYPWWGRLSLYPYYDDRFDNGILTGAFYAGRYLNESRAVSAFGTVSVTRDSRSVGGAVPAIFSDNYLLGAVGLRVQPLRGLAADLQLGVALSFDTRPAVSTTKGDLRAILTYGNGLYAPFSFPEEAEFLFSPWADVYTSAGYYSRYENFIGYTLARAGVRFFETGFMSMDAYLRGDLAWDSSRLFYNNIAEGSAGLRWTPHFEWGLSFALEYHRGFYWDQSLSTGELDRWYSSTRIIAVFDRNIIF